MVETVNQKIRSKARKAWGSMLIHPRQTIRARLQASEKRPWLFLGALVGLAQLCNAPFLYAHLGPGPQEVLSWIVVVGPLTGWILANLAGLIISKLGRALFRGQASLQDSRTAFLWGCLPLVYSMVIWIPSIYLFWGPDWLNILEQIRPAAALFSVWTAWTLTMAIAEAHQVRGIQAFAVLVLTFSILSLPLSFFSF